MNILRPRSRIAALFLLSLVGLGVWVGQNPNWLRIENIQMELVEHSHEDLLYQRIKKSLFPVMKVYEGKLFWDVPLRELFDLIARDKRVRTVSVHREFPSTLRISIEPHTPVLAWVGRDGRIYPVATDATLLPALPLSDLPDMVLLRGEEFKEDIQLRDRALEIFRTLPDGGVFGKRKVSEIVYGKKDGFDVFVSGSRSQVRLGDTDFSPRVSRVERVLTYLDSQNIKGRVIDARFSKKVVVRVRNTP